LPDARSADRLAKLPERRVTPGFVCAIAVEVSTFLIGILFVLAILYIVSNMLSWF
jgi:hypothetical protein